MTRFLSCLGAGVVATALCGMPFLAHAADSHGGDGAAGGGLPQFDPTWFASQIFWLAIAFTILFVYITKVALPRLTNVLDHRSNAIRADVAETERCRRESDKLSQQIESRLNAARDQATADMLAVQTTLRDKAAVETARFQERFDRSVRDTENRLVAARSAALADIQAHAADLAVLAAAKAGGSSADPTLARSLVDDLARQGKKAA